MDVKSTKVNKLGIIELAGERDRTSIKKITRCIKTCMTIAGLYYVRLNHCVAYVKLIYPLILLSLTLAETSMFFHLLKSDDPFKDKILKIQAILDTFKVSFLQIIFILRITPGMRNFFKAFNDYTFEYRSRRNVTEIKKSLRKYVFFGYLILMPTCVMLNIMLIYLVIVPHTLLSHMVVNYSPKDTVLGKSTMYVMSSVSAILFTFYEYINVTGFIFIFFVCYLLGHEYEVMTSDFRHDIKENDSDQRECDAIMRNFRRRFLHLNRITAQVNSILGPLVLAIILFSLALLVFHVVCFVNIGSYGIPENYELTFILVSGLDRILHLGFFLYSGILLNSKAAVVRPVLLSIDVENKSQKFYQETMLLLQKVNHDHNGLTAYGVINISKTFIVTVVTLGLSYGIIMLRFGLSLNKAPDAAEILTNATIFEATTQSAD